MKNALGCCYYPEHWPSDIWQEDAQRMRDNGLEIVRIGEFAWSRLEPEYGCFEWDWLDQAVEVLAAASLKIVLGTPTATPPRWMLDRHPDMLAVDVDGHLRKFGSRRHYCFSHAGYRQESVRIAELMAERYGKHDALCAWQIDNEYGCHDTVLSYSVAAQNEFRIWLEQRYQTIDSLNEAWGNVFWSMEYADFSNIDLPNLTVTEANPSHVLDFKRFSSDQVVRYNLAQVDAIQKHSDKDLIHNYMGKVTSFDHFDVGEDLQIASWDSYPLGFLDDRCNVSEEWKLRFYQQGDPDLQALHHDLYRVVGHGRWWIMEQQPGPVNWANYNPAPLPGMVRLWSLEAFAHGAEAVCYFRWRQAPFAQEQMHAGLLRPDSVESPAIAEVRETSKDLQSLGSDVEGTADVAIVFDYTSAWAWETQAQGQDFDYFDLVLSQYRGLRRLGLNIDILPPSCDDFSAYRLVLIPGLMAWTEQLKAAITKFDGIVLAGPRTGSKTDNFRIPESLPPGMPDLNCKINYVESLRPGVERSVLGGGFVHRWMESLQHNATVLMQTTTQQAVAVEEGKQIYLGAWLNDTAMIVLLAQLCDKANIVTTSMPEGVRQRRTKTHRLVFNHNAEPVEFEGVTLAPAEVVIQSLS